MDKEYQAKSNIIHTIKNFTASLALPCDWCCYSVFKVLSACLQFCTVSMNPIACTRLDSRTDEHLCQTIHSVYCMVRSTRLLPIRNEKLEMRNCGMRFADGFIIEWGDRSEKWGVAVSAARTDLNIRRRAEVSCDCRFRWCFDLEPLIKFILWIKFTLASRLHALRAALSIKGCQNRQMLYRCVQLFKKFAQRFIFDTAFCAKAAETGISLVSAAFIIICFTWIGTIAFILSIDRFKL